MRISHLLAGVSIFLPTMLMAATNSPFYVEQVIDLQNDYSPYQLTLEEHATEAEGDVFIEYHILANRNNQTEYDLTVNTPEDEISSEDSSWEVQSVDILTSDYTDQAGIHIGSSVRDFYAAYPKAQAYYAPESDMLWLTREGLNFDATENIYYIVPNSSYIANIDINSDLILLDREGFSNNASITAINLW